MFFFCTCVKEKEGEINWKDPSGEHFAFSRCLHFCFVHVNLLQRGPLTHWAVSSSKLAIPCHRKEAQKGLFLLLDFCLPFKIIYNWDIWLFWTEQSYVWKKDTQRKDAMNNLQTTISSVSAQESFGVQKFVCILDWRPNKML